MESAKRDYVSGCQRTARAFTSAHTGCSFQPAHVCMHLNDYETFQTDTNHQCVFKRNFIKNDVREDLKLQQKFPEVHSTHLTHLPPLPTHPFFSTWQILLARELSLRRQRLPLSSIVPKPV